MKSFDCKRFPAPPQPQFLLASPAAELLVPPVKCPRSQGEWSRELWTRVEGGGRKIGGAANRFDCDDASKINRCACYDRLTVSALTLPSARSDARRLYNRSDLLLGSPSVLEGVSWCPGPGQFLPSGRQICTMSTTQAFSRQPASCALRPAHSDSESSRGHLPAHQRST
jgi:hypothetical protein